MANEKNKIIYSKVPIPEKEEKIDPKTYTYKVRRAEILGMIKTVGSPGAVSPTKLAGRYGVTHSQISHDIKVLKKELFSQIGEDVAIRTELTFNKVVTELLESPNNKDKYNAAKLMKEWNDWLFDAGVNRRAPTQVEDVTDQRVDDIWDEIKEKEKDGKDKKADQR